MATVARVAKPEIKVTRTASQAAIDTQLDLERMMFLAVIEQARYFRSVAPALLAEAVRSFTLRGYGLFVVPFSTGELFAHMERVAELLVATRMLGRVRVRREVGLKDAPGNAIRLNGGTNLEIAAPGQTFAEVLKGVGVAEAVKYLQSLPVATRDEWQRMTRNESQRAFIAAGVENKAALEALKKLVIESLEKGLSPGQFEKAATELLAKFQTEAGSLRTLWNTLTANAMAKGRQEMMRDPEVRRLVPYQLYDAFLDAATRPNHRALDGGIAPWDWDGWGLYAPPNGFNCRCVIIALNRIDAERRLAQGGRYFDLTQGVPAGAGPDEGWEKFSEPSRRAA